MEIGDLVKGPHNNLYIIIGDGVYGQFWRELYCFKTSKVVDYQIWYLEAVQ